MPGDFEDLAKRAADLVDSGRSLGVALRSVGGVAIWHRLSDELRSEYERVREAPKDLDLVAPAGTAAERIKSIFVEQGYTPNERLIAWRGDKRHQYFELDDSGQPRVEVDVFLGPPPACHKFDLPADEFDGDDVALSPTELLLQKLQIVEVTEKDVADIAYLLRANPASLNGAGLDTGRIAKLLSQDWGFYYTATQNLDRVQAFASERLEGASRDEVSQRVGRLRDEIEAAPKSRKWKIRAKLGTKVSWYEEVEELDR